MKKVFCMAAVVLAVCLMAGAAFAAPTVKRSRNEFQIENGVNDAILAQIAAEMGQVKPEELAFQVKNINDADLAKLCAAYPNMVRLGFRDCKDITSFAPLAGLKSLRELRGSEPEISDFSPLAGLTEMRIIYMVTGASDLKWMSGMTNLTSIGINMDGNKERPLVSLEGLPSLPNLKSISIGHSAPADLTPLVAALPALETITFRRCKLPNLAPLAKLANLNVLLLEGSALDDFSPLAASPSLRRVNITTVITENYSTIAKLTQIEEIGGEPGRNLTDISWIADMPNLKKFELHNQGRSITDFSPISKANLQVFAIRGLRELEKFDLSHISGAVSLNNLRVANIKNLIAPEALGALVNLKDLNLQDSGSASNAIDLAFFSKLAELTTLNLNGATVTNFDAIAACAKLETVDLQKVNGVTSIAALHKLPALKEVTVTKGVFPDAELAGFAAGVKITQR